MISYRKLSAYTGIQILFLVALYITQFSMKITNNNEVVEAITNYFSYYDLSLFILILIPLLIFSLSIFVKEKTLYQTTRMRKERLYVSKCLLELLEISKFILIYSTIGAAVFLRTSSNIVFSEFMKQNLIFFLLAVIYAQLYTMIEVINGSRKKVMNGFITVSFIMGSYFTFKDVFSFFNLNYSYYVMGIKTNIFVYLPLLITIPIFLFITNYFLFKEKDIL